MKIFFSGTLFILFFLSFVFVSCLEKETEVIVIGTIHHFHSKNLNYTYDNIIQILASYKPDVICVEIRPQDFRKIPYLKEMMLASSYGFNNNKNVFPIDWSEGEDRSKRSMTTPEYIEKEKKLSELESKNEIMKNFAQKHGSDMIHIFQEKDYLFFNGKEYNEYVKEVYKLSVSVFGDDPHNLHYITRNENMLKLIAGVIDKNQGKKIIILTGAEHKHYFDEKLRMSDKIRVRDIMDILPLSNPDESSEKIDTSNPKSMETYFDVFNKNNLVELYIAQLTPILHGPSMDLMPETIPRDNIVKAELIINEIKDRFKDSTILKYEMGWLNLLMGNYKEALNYFDAVKDGFQKLNDGDYSDFIKAFVYRNIGICYDMLDDRAKALEAYKKGENEVSNTQFSIKKDEIYRKLISESYKTVKN
jgi:tetratricopeptide (TPR) repeat protein